jgi:hypothetical protein
MTKYKELIDLKKASIFLIALPYLIFNYENIIHSPFFSFTQLFFIFAFILLIDVLIKWGLAKLNEKVYTTISLFIVFISILFLYGIYISSYIQKIFKENFHILIRGRTIIEISIIPIILLILILRKKNIYYKYLNVFLVLFNGISLFTSIINTNEKIKEEFKSSFISMPLNNNQIKPILLIISDEYTSPDGLYQIYKDSSLYQFSNELANKRWIVKNSFYSYEISTIHSLSSLFNFNLSKNKEYKKEGAAIIGANKLLHANIADSLEKKKVEIVNFGIFHLGKHPYLNRLYPYPTSFIEDIMMYTIYYTIKTNTGNLNKSGFDGSYYPMETHNKYIFNHLADTLNTLTNNKTFAYIHLFMPHSPMQYKPSFPIRTQNSILNYKAYWDFTNQKLNTLLTKLIRGNKYRIILIGDHGYRGDKRINPHYTFSAFYGFNEEFIDKINSVQDLGSLINGYF